MTFRRLLSAATVVAMCCALGLLPLAHADVPVVDAGGNATSGGSAPLELTIALRPAGDPRSPAPGVPTSASRAAVTTWLRAHDFVVTDAGPWAVTAHAPAPTAKHAFGVTAPAAEPRLPSQLAPHVTSVLGFDTTTRLTHRAQLDRTKFLDGADLRSAYAAPTGANSRGEGTTIASVQFASWDRTDLCRFVTHPNAPTYNRSLAVPRFSDKPRLCSSTAAGPVIDQRAVGRFNPQAANARIADGSLEVALDQEALLAVAPRANQRIYFASNNPKGWVDAFTKLANDAEADVAAKRRPPVAVTLSWGMCERAYEKGSASDPIPAWELQLKRLAALGIPVFAASGDHGAYDCTDSTNPAPAVDYPASSPRVIAVGGTRLTESAPGKRDWRETAWGPTLLTSKRSASASGGGTSARFAIPAYQKAIGLTGTKRQVPDIASSADSQLGLLIYGSTYRRCGDRTGWCGGWISAGGTSSGAPVQAALFASAISTFGPNRPAVGTLHDILYGNAQGLRDIRTGTNGRYLATRGYDRVTGLGTPAWTSLLDALNAPAVLLPAATKHTSVPIRIVTRGPRPTGYSYGEGLSECPRTPQRRTAPTTVKLTAGADRVASVGVCLHRGATATLITRSVTVDRTAPTVAPTATVGATRVQLRWGSDDAAGAGVAVHRVSVTNTATGAVAWSTSLQGASATLALPRGATYRVAVRATDAARNVSATKTTTVRVPPA